MNTKVIIVHSSHNYEIKLIIVIMRKSLTIYYYSDYEKDII